MLNMSSIADVFSRNFPKIFRTAILRENLLMDVPYFIKDHLFFMSDSDEATIRKNLDGIKSS